MQEAFEELSTDRGFTQTGALPIPFSAIDSYATRFRIHDFDVFLAMIRAMDRVWLDRVNRKDE